jgi:hypothetical protein
MENCWWLHSFSRNYHMKGALGEGLGFTSSVKLCEEGDYPVITKGRAHLLARSRSCSWWRMHSRFHH